MSIQKSVEIKPRTCYHDTMMERVKYSYTKDQAEKYRQIILYALKCCGHPNGIPKTKLAKEVCLADFIWYYENNESMSGMEYRKRKFGPVADAFFSFIDEMEQDGIINCEILTSPTGKGKNTLLYSLAKTKMPFDKLAEEEKTLIEQICKAWESAKPKKIIEFTHEQLPWKICRDDEVIPYSLITQEELSNVFGPVQLLLIA